MTSAPTRTRLVAVVPALLVVFLLLLLAVERSWQPVIEVDELGRDGLHDIFEDTDAGVFVLKGISRASTGPVYAVILVGVLVWLARARRYASMLFTLATALGYLLSPTIKGWVERPRPTLADPVGSAGGYSFPSGHATQAMLMAVLMLALLLPVVRAHWRPRLVALAVLCVGAIGFSRLGLGVHYVSDVVAGYAVGGAWALTMVALLRPDQDRGAETGTVSSMVAEPSTRSPS